MSCTKRFRKNRCKCFPYQVNNVNHAFIITGGCCRTIRFQYTARFTDCPQRCKYTIIYGQLWSYHRHKDYFYTCICCRCSGIHASYYLRIATREISNKFIIGNGNFYL